MATQTEQMANDALKKIDVLRAEFDFLQKQLERLGLDELRVQMTKIKTQLEGLEKATEQLKPSKAEAEEMGALKNRLSQLEEHRKLGDTRVFQFIILFVGGVVTPLINIVLLFLKK